MALILQSGVDCKLEQPPSSFSSSKMSNPVEREQKTTETLVTSMEKSLETPSEKKKRLISLGIVHLSMLVMSLGSSIIFTGVYPYLISVKYIFCDTTLEKVDISSAG